MCRWGEFEEVMVPIHPAVSNKKMLTWRKRKIDRCISSLIKDMNNNYLYTTGSNCGHGTDYGCVVLWTGNKVSIPRARLMLDEVKNA